jgi:hypothetical protein
MASREFIYKAHLAVRAQVAFSSRAFKFQLRNYRRKANKKIIIS